MPMSRLREEAAEAVPLLEQALLLEPDYASAHGWLAWCHEVLFVWGGFKEEQPHRSGPTRARRHREWPGRCDSAGARGAFTIGMSEHDRMAAREAFERALTLSPSCALALFIGGVMLAYSGDAEGHDRLGDACVAAEPGRSARLRDAARNRHRPVFPGTLRGGLSTQRVGLSSSTQVSSWPKLS